MDKFLYNNRLLRDRRKELRKNQTEAEKILWQHLRRNQIQGVRFFRQYSVGPYILDFYAPKIRLAIELDGGGHRKEESVFYDKDRDKYLNTVYIHTIRFWNDEILKNIKGVLQKIIAEVEILVPPLK